MPADPCKPSVFEPSVLDQLGCPACLGGLRLVETMLICADCGLSYPVVDGIPVLISGCEELGANPGACLD